jgi:hypothetical protein
MIFMKNLNKVVLALFTVFGAMHISSANAVEPLTSQELADHCSVYQTNPQGVDGVFCERYIQGFIDGAMSTDVAVAFNVSKLYDEDVSMTERAIRTRIGSRLQRYGSYYAEFCLEEPLALKEVVNEVSSRLVNGQFTGENLLARNVVFQILRETHPCQND